MSAYIPIELQQQIIKSLPVKKLLQCRSVSKSWKSLIDSPEFVAVHSVACRTRPQHLLVRYEAYVGSKKIYVSFIDDDSFPQKKFAPTVPTSVDLLYRSRIIGTSLGLFCLYGYDEERGAMAFLWNPSIRKSVAITVPDVVVLHWSYDTDLGFGVCPDILDPKIVKIRQSVERWKVEVYTLSSGKWRSLTSSNLPRSSIQLKGCQVVIDRFIYLLALDQVSVEGSFQLRNLIMSFDITSENFGVVDLPDCLARHSGHPWSISISISKIRESLAVLQFIDAYTEYYTVWAMEDGVQKPFRKLFTIKAPLLIVNWPLEFRKSGEPIMVMYDPFGSSRRSTRLHVYEPISQRINDLGICGRFQSFLVNFCMETLLLHGWSD